MVNFNHAEMINSSNDSSFLATLGVCSPWMRQFTNEEYTLIVVDCNLITIHNDKSMSLRKYSLEPTLERSNNSIRVYII